MGEKFYITTPIYYVNDKPHIGHAYTTIIADVLARYKRLWGAEVFFLTGTDEHGQKVEKAAEAGNESPQALADRMASHFQQLWQRLAISNDDFIRTTQPRHLAASTAFFLQVYQNGDIYKGEYEDWYCTPCESFWTRGQLAADGSCPECSRPTERLREESYFFRLSKYEKPLLEYMEAHPDFIFPASRRQEVLSFIKGGLRDLSISRTSFNWGVPLPIDPKHIIYVWFDALTNYLTAIGYPQQQERFKHFWPADVHLMSKDILRFHAVYWPAFLMAAGLPLPKRVVVHGWWTVEGKKMSKSLGNTVDPNLFIDQYGIDALRYFVLREVSFGSDGNFSQQAFIQRLNSDLANDLGNLLYRSLTMVEKYFNGIIPASGTSEGIDKKLAQSAQDTIGTVSRLLEEFAFNKALVKIWWLIDKNNKYIDEMAPWHLSKNPAQQERLGTVIYNILEVLRLVAVTLQPFLPLTGEKMWQQLGLGDSFPDCLPETAKTWGGTKAGTQIKKGTPLFPRVEIK